MSGLLGELFKQFNIMGIKSKPELLNNELVITITEQEFKEVVFKGLDERAKNNISIKLEDGKIVIKVKLF
mgnify:FL=1